MRGLTLLELLVVVGILAALAGVGWGAYQGVQQEAQDTLADARLAQVAEALRRFKADTGHWPGDGPFALTAAANAETVLGSRQVSCSDTSAGLWLRSELPAIVVPAAVTDVEAWRARWATHPANLWQLQQAPLLCANHPKGRLQDWQPEPARGWRGPYLAADQLGWVEVGSGLDADGTGDPGSGALLSNLRGLPAGRALPPVAEGHGPCAGASADCAWRWRLLPTTASGFDAAHHTLARQGRPLLYFGPASGRPRLVWTGPDGRFGGLSAAGTAQACEPNTAQPEGLDDRIVCLD
jgi:prepilin-type N-terminal cleavage/methylation domain-containing protein